MKGVCANYGVLKYVLPFIGVESTRDRQNTKKYVGMAKVVVDAADMLILRGSREDFDHLTICWKVGPLKKQSESTNTIT